MPNETRTLSSNFKIIEKIEINRPHLMTLDSSSNNLTAFNFDFDFEYFARTISFIPRERKKMSSSDKFFLEWSHVFFSFVTLIDVPKLRVLMAT